MKLLPKLRTLLFCLSILLFPMLVSAYQQDAYSVKKISFPVQQVQTLSLFTSGGSLTVKGDASGAATLEVLVKTSNKGTYSEQEIHEILERDYDIRIVHTGTTLEASAKPKKALNWRNSLSISFVVHTGQNLNTELITSGGSISLEGLSGNLTFKTSGGSLNIQSLTGTIHGFTSGGSIRAANSRGDLSLATSGGSITMANLAGTLEVKTSGGSIHGEQLAGSLQAATSGGSISLSGLKGRVYAATSGGSIAARFDEVDGQVDLKTAGGSITIDVPALSAIDLKLKGTRVKASQLPGFSGVNLKGTLTGRLNGGGNAVNAHTSAGQVILELH